MRPSVLRRAVLVATLGGSIAAGAFSQPAGAATPALPLATSIETAQGTWATVAMGDLSQPLNTFWQLLYQPSGSSSWSNHVEATATATNGGLVLGSDGSAVAVGVRPSNELHYSPLITSSNGGRSWSNGLLAEGLLDAPAALAFSPRGSALALVQGDAGAAVDVSTSPGLTRWRTLVTQAEVAKEAGRRCGLVSLTAVGYDGTAPILGASCAHDDVVGLFEQRGASWRAVGPSLPIRALGGPIEVLDLASSGNGAAAVLQVTGRSGSAIMVAWETTSGTDWQLGPALPLGGAERLVSVGAAGSGGIFVLTSRNSEGRLAVIDGPGSHWSELPSPPAGTATVAFGPNGGPQALSVRRTVLQVWSLGAGGWTSAQVLHVPVQFGSSS